MRKYRNNAASPIRVDFGVDLAAGLRRFPETAALADELEKTNDALFAQYLARLAARKPMVAARVPVRFANHDTDQVLRDCAHAARQADGAQGGPIFKSIFKDGLGPAVRPNGARQIPATETVIADMKKSAAHGIDAFRAVWIPRIQDSLAVLQKAAATQDTLRDAYLAAYAEEIALRNQHYTAVDRIIGQVRAAFPGNTTKQDLVFPEVIDEGEEEAAAEQAAPAPEPAPAPAPVTKPSAKPA
ncbi:MAG: hypothetical protein QM820_27480 [Minicystis sp.]